MVVHETYRAPDGTFVQPADVRIETSGGERRHPAELAAAQNADRGPGGQLRGRH
jgi:hypothetical protein